MRFLRFFPCCKCGLGFGTFSVFGYFFADLSTVYVFADVRIAIPVLKFSNFDLEAHNRPCIWKTSWQEPQKRQIGKSDNPRLHPIFRVLFPCLRCCFADSAEGNHVHQSGFIESFVQCSVGSYLSRLPLL